MLRWLPLAVLALAGLAGLVWSGDYTSTSEAGYAPPSLAHWLGTDRQGRDLLGRILVSTRAFFVPGLLSVFVAVIVGVPLGVLAGWEPPEEAWEHRRRGRRLARRLFRSLATVALVVPSALPRLVVIILICTALRFDPFLLGAVAGLVYAGELGEDLRFRISSALAEEYVEAARADGLSWRRILWHHVLWLQCRRLVLRHLVQLWAYVLLLETSLSFLPGGFGVQEPEPSWGNLLGDFARGGWSEPVWPSLLLTAIIVGTVVSLAMLGDRLADEPREQP